MPEGTSTRSIRKKLLQDGWDVPANNLLAIYLAGCEAHGVVAQSGICQKLLARARALQPHPFHAVARQAAQGRVALLDMCTAHITARTLDLHTPSIPLDIVDKVVAAFNPRLPLLDALAQSGIQLPPTPPASNPKGPSTLRNPLPPFLPALNATLGSSSSSSSSVRGGRPSQATQPLETTTITTRGPNHMHHSSTPGPSPTFLTASAHAPVSATGLGHAPPLPLPPAPLLSPTQLRQLLEAVTRHLGQSQVQQGALEVMSAWEEGLQGMGPADPLLPGVVMERLDEQHKGTVAAADFQAALLTLHHLLQGPSPQGPGAADSPCTLLPSDPPLAALWGGGQGGGAGCSPAAAEVLQRGGQQQVNLQEGVAVLQEVLPGLTAKAVYAFAQGSIRTGYTHDFSHDRVGPAGLPPLLAALKHDATFTGLALPRSGIDCSATALLCQALQGHSHLTHLDLSHNTIADKGGQHLLSLLQSNRCITRLDLTGTPLMSRHSRTHHDRLGASLCEDGRPLQAALDLNIRAARKGARQLVTQLLEVEDGLKAVFWGLAGPSGQQVPLAELVRELNQVAAAEWGYSEHVLLDEVLLHERLVGARLPHANLDDDGTPPPNTFMVSYGEVRALLLGLQYAYASPRHGRVAMAVRHHRAAVKREFYRLSDATRADPNASTQRRQLPQADGQQDADQDGAQEQHARDREAEDEAVVSLAALRVALLQLSLDQGWDLAVADLETVLVQDTFCADADTPPTAGLVQPCRQADDEQFMLNWSCFYGRLLAMLAV